jgi:hypothetical protein
MLTCAGVYTRQPGGVDVGEISVTFITIAGGWKGVGKVVPRVGSSACCSRISLFLMATMVPNPLTSIGNASLIHSWVHHLVWLPERLVGLTPFRVKSLEKVLQYMLWYSLGS